LPEPCRADVGGPMRAAQALGEREELSQRVAPLLLVGPPRVRDEPRGRGSIRALDLGDERGESRQAGGRRGLRVREERPVARELLQVQVARSEPLLPVPDRRARHAELARDRRHRRPHTLTRLDDRERQLHGRRLPRQHVQRVHPLTVLAVAADGLPDRA